MWYTYSDSIHNLNLKKECNHVSYNYYYALLNTFFVVK